MPLYEYECRQCHQRIEKIQSFSAPPEKVCPSCGGELERVISAPAIQFKGAGWYVNDYAKSGAKAKPAEGGESKSHNKSDGGAGEKPEAKSESKSDKAGGKSSGDSAAAPGSSSSSSDSGSSSGSGGNAKPSPAKSTAPGSGS